MPKAISSATLSVGLLAIPVKMFTAASSEQQRFNMLHAGCGSRLKQQYICASHETVVGKDETVRGFEHSKGQYVIFTDEELKSLEAERSNVMEIVTFVPASTVDFIGSIEKTYFLGPDKGADKSYSLISVALQHEGKVAVARWAARGKEQLIIIRPHNGGLVLHQMFYQNEVRSFQEVLDTVAKFQFSDKEIGMATNLITQMSDESYDGSQYSDDYAQRVMEAVQQKLAGQEITIAPAAKVAQVADLFAALQASADAAKEKKASKGNGKADKADKDSKRKPAAPKATKAKASKAG
jgi:DNA end-binding protein Ku